MNKHRCFEMEVDGTIARINGDPDMSPESRAALEDLIRATVKRAERERQKGAAPNRIIWGLRSAGAGVSSE